jgi:hypothetical protein
VGGHGWKGHKEWVCVRHAVSRRADWEGQWRIRLVGSSPTRPYTSVRDRSVCERYLPGKLRPGGGKYISMITNTDNSSSIYGGGSEGLTHSLWVCPLRSAVLPWLRGSCAWPTTDHWSLCRRESGSDRAPSSRAETETINGGDNAKNNANTIKPAVLC